MKKLKKIIVFIVVLILVLSVGRCGKDDTASEEKDAGTADTYETVEDSSEEADEESADTDSDSDSDSDSNSNSNSNSGSDSGVLSPEFKKTMDDYEAWFDHYCDVMKRYQEDSSDLELLSEMTELLSEETTMLEQMENMDESEMNAAELAYYLEVTARIEKKLLEVAE